MRILRREKRIENETEQVRKMEEKFYVPTELPKEKQNKEDAAVYEVQWQ